MKLQFQTMDIVCARALDLDNNKKTPYKSILAAMPKRSLSPSTPSSFIKSITSIRIE